MHAMLVVVALKFEEPSLEISRGPEQHAIQTFAPYGPDQPFDDRVGTRHGRHRLDLLDVEDSQVRLPLTKPVQRTNGPHSGKLVGTGRTSRD
jgi:hypothetical protein